MWCFIAVCVLGVKGYLGTSRLLSGTVSKRLPVWISMIQSVRNNTAGIENSGREPIIYSTLDERCSDIPCATLTHTAAWCSRGVCCAGSEASL